MGGLRQRGYGRTTGWDGRYDGDLASFRLLAIVRDALALVFALGHRSAAAVIRGRKVHDGVRMLIFPATQEIYLQAMREGLMEAFVAAGAAFSTPTCGPCLGGHMGILAKGERAISTTNRNFVGRMGHPESEVYLSNPAVAAASAVLGRIGGPDEL